MGNRETWNHVQESQQAQFGDTGRLARARETPLGFSGELSKPEKEHVLLSRARGAEALKQEQLPAPETHRALTEQQASSIDFQEYRSLKEQARAQAEKIHDLTTERNELRDENARLQEENQELRQYVERRKEQNKEASARRRKKNRRQYNEYERERRRAKSQ